VRDRRSGTPERRFCVRSRATIRRPRYKCLAGGDGVDGDGGEGYVVGYVVWGAGGGGRGSGETEGKK
jgi:hypothetical protein